MTIEQFPLISRATIFGNPDHVGVKLSPNGQHLTYIAPWEGVLNIWFAEGKDLSKARPLTKDQGRGIRTYSWCQDNEHILYTQDKDGDENWHIYGVSIHDEAVQDFTPFEGVQAHIAHISPQHSTKVLVLINHRRQDFHDLYELNITSGHLNCIYENNQFVDLITDDEFAIHFGVAPTADGGSQIYRFTLDEVGAQKMEAFLTIPETDFLTTNPLGLSKDKEWLYLSYSLGRNTSALVSLHIQTKEIKIIGEDTKADFSDALIHPTKKHIQAFASTYDRKHWQIVDPSIEPDFTYLRSVAHGDIEVISRSLDDQYWIVCFLRDVGAPHYYLYTRGKKSAQFLFSGRASIDKLPMTEMLPCVISSRDGLELVCYLSLPANVRQASPGVPEKPLPMVLLVHGGPWARDTWGYDSMHQWLSNRGYAVISVNYRGSTGFGKAFLNAGNGEWARKMHDDLLDVVEWAVANKITHRETIAIMGGSYGG